MPAAQVVTSGAGHVTSTYNIDATVADATNVRVSFSFTPAGLTARSTPQSVVAVVHRAAARVAPPPTTAAPTATTVEAATTTVEATTTTEAAATTSTTIQ